MEAQHTAGASLHDADAERRREAARALGSARTEKKAAASRANGKNRVGSQWTEEQKANLRARRAEIRQEQEQARIAAGVAAPVQVEKKRPGRPRKEVTEVAGEKRGRGRPKKQDGQTAAQTAMASQNGTGEAGRA